MKAISINGHDLTKIRLKLNPLQDGIFSYITYPIDKFSSEVRQGLMYLSIPSHLMVELYKQKILPVDNTQVTMLLDYDKTGEYELEDLVYPNTYEQSNEFIYLKFKLIK